LTRGGSGRFGHFNRSPGRPARGPGESNPRGRDGFLAGRQRMRAYALLGEIEEDLAILGGEAVMARLGETLDALTRDRGGSFLVPVTPTGHVPEFAGILSDPSVAYPLARALAEGLHPLAVRTAVAVGEFPETPEGSYPLDGPPFDVAAELLYRARKEDRLVLYGTEHLPVDALANALVLLLHRDLKGWTERQAQVVRLYRRYGRQKAVADELGVSQQAVSSALTAVGWKAMREAERTLEGVFAPRTAPVSG
jgi:hypothetical protein